MQQHRLSAHQALDCRLICRCCGHKLCTLLHIAPWHKVEGALAGDSHFPRPAAFARIHPKGRKKRLGDDTRSQLQMEVRSTGPEASFHPRKLGRDLAPAAVSPPFLSVLGCGRCRRADANQRLSRETCSRPCFRLSRLPRHLAEPSTHPHPAHECDDPNQQQRYETDQPG